MGFRTFYTSGTLEDDIGLSSGAKLGVIGDAGTVMRGDVFQGGYAPDGSQYYMMEDTDGFVYVEMDAVEVTDYTNVQMKGWVHVESTTWEETDRLKVWASDTGTFTEVVLLEGTELDSAVTGISTG